MNNRNKIALCCALVMALAPFAAAHLTQKDPSLTSTMLPADGDDGCRYLPADVNGDCVGNSGPSGTYFNLGNGFFTEVGSMPVGAALDSEIGITFFPNGWYGTGAFGTLCDMEVQSDGNYSTMDDNTADETTVDGDSSGGGDQVDGNIDDGGDGSVCHVRSYVNDGSAGPGNAATHEGYAENVTYDTLGCTGVAPAEDAVSGPDVWLTANCDWESFVNDNGGGLNCLVNELIQARQVAVITGCIAEIVSDEVSPVTVVPEPVCGGDGGSDNAGNYGRGGGDSPGKGIAYPTLTDGCGQNDATASAGVMSSIQVPGPTLQVGVMAGEGCDVDQLEGPCVGLDLVEAANVAGCAQSLATCALHVSGYSLGWIDWNAGGEADAWEDGGGIHVQVLPSDDCSDNIDNDPWDGTSDTDEEDSPGSCDSDPVPNPVPGSCDDGIDNDNDGDTDTDDTVDCSGANGNETPGSCADFFDNDNDDLTDSDDKDCHADGNNENPFSYDPSLKENGTDDEN